MRVSIETRKISRVPLPVLLQLNLDKKGKAYYDFALKRGKLLLLFANLIRAEGFNTFLTVPIWGPLPLFFHPPHHVYFKQE
jgi:hypothetical protein